MTAPGNGVRALVKRSAMIVGGIGLLMVLIVGDRYMGMLLSLPVMDGTFHVDTVNDIVDVIRDEHAIPHIFGQSEEDIYFGLGVAHAQDRLWQMEFTRRIGQGRLSEILGKRSLGLDIFFRTLNFGSSIDASLPRLSAPVRRVLAAYADGVNFIINDGSKPLPPEFLLLFHRPEPWTPADSLLIIKVMSVGLSTNMFHEIERAQLVQFMNEKQIAEFFPPYPGDEAIKLPDFADLYGRTFFKLDQASLFEPHKRGASNSWVVNGRHTNTGAALLANDPHLELAAPSIWYLAHLALPGGNVMGATIAGFPSIILGRNERISWGFTNTGADTQDLFVEKLNPDNPNEYLTPDGYVPFDTREERITIRFARDQNLLVRETRHGPVLPQSWRGSDQILDDGYVLALQWTALQDDDLTAEAAIRLADAGNWAEALDALQFYHSPMQNIIYADIDGNIGFIAPARVPIRKPENNLKGLMPAPGWDARYDWAGYIPFEDLPQQYNPSSGRIVTANDKIVPDDYPYFITSQWQPPFRARRISQLLTGIDRHDVSSFMAMQRDEISLLALDILPLMLNAEAATDEVRQALDLLRFWNGDMDGDSAEPLVFVAWYRELARLVYADELGASFQRHWSFKPIFMQQVLNSETDQQWCDDIQTADRESCEFILGQALERALDQLYQDHGADMSAWRWGESHKAVHGHGLFGSISVLSGIFNLEISTGGGFYTINRGGHWFSRTRPFANIHGSSYRAIYDMADFENSFFMQSTGQSGNVFSAHYDQFIDSWARVDYVPMIVKRSTIEKNALGMLRFSPLSSP